MLVASHEMRLVWDLCPRTVILDRGRLVADGPTLELLQDSAIMDRHGLETPYAYVPLAHAPVHEPSNS